MQTLTKTHGRKFIKLPKTRHSLTARNKLYFIDKYFIYFSFQNGILLQKGKLSPMKRWRTMRTQRWTPLQRDLFGSSFRWAKNKQIFIVSLNSRIKGMIFYRTKCWHTLLDFLSIFHYLVMHVDFWPHEELVYIIMHTHIYLFYFVYDKKIGPCVLSNSELNDYVWIVG